MEPLVCKVVRFYTNHSSAGLAGFHIGAQGFGGLEFSAGRGVCGFQLRVQILV